VLKSLIDQMEVNNCEIHEVIREIWRIVACSRSRVWKFGNSCVRNQLQLELDLIEVLYVILPLEYKYVC